WLEAMERFEWVVQTAPFSKFDVQPGADRGAGRVVAQERFKRADGVLGRLLAIYHDEYVRTPDGWRFASRQLEIRDFE
ncbi:MAG: nuclear transport factor 2 family protein, partial [Actinomycetota bacterium]